MRRYCAVCGCGIDKDGRRMPHVRLGLNKFANFEACAECTAKLPANFPLPLNVPNDGPCPRCGSDSLLRIPQGKPTTHFVCHTCGHRWQPPHSRWSRDPAGAPVDEDVES